MAYEGSTSVNEMDTARPSDVEKGSILGQAIREVKRILKSVVDNQHNPDGSHKTGAIPGSALQDGTVDPVKISGTIPADKLSAPESTAVDSVTTTSIVDLNVTGAKIAAATITPDKLTGATEAYLLIGQPGGTWDLKAVSGAITIDKNGVVSASSGAGLSNAALAYAYVQGSTVAGGTFTSGAWQTQPFNSEIVDTANLGVLSANEFTITGKGLFSIDVWAVGNAVDLHQLRATDTTTTPTVIVYGNCTDAAAAGPYQSTATLSFVANITVSPFKFIIEHRATTTRASDGFGKDNGFGNANTYAFLRMIKLD